MADQDDIPSFTCYNCKQENYYNPSDYNDSRRGGELLMEMYIMKSLKTKDVLINCNNPKCNHKNTVTISYYG